MKTPLDYIGSSRTAAIAICRAVIVLLGLIFLGIARAHDPGISTVQGELRGSVLQLTTGFAPADAQQLLPPASRTDEKWTETEFEAARDQLLVVAPLLWEVRVGETLLVPRDVRVELLPGDNVSFHLVYPLPGDAKTLTLRAPKIPELPPGHRQFVIISDEGGSTVAKKLLSARDFSVEVSPGGVGSTGGNPLMAASSDDSLTAWGFLKLGVEHIWTGYDHLLFLFALLVVCQSFRSIIGIITCFTVAHSLTLALATFDIVRLPPRLVEATIAASIVFVGVENLLRRGAEPKGRWALTFGFGLVHGFGFASVLRDLGLGTSGEGIVVPLLTFNLGVEAGQIVIAAVVMPLLWRLRRHEGFMRRGVPAFSAMVAAAGLYWLVERTFGS